MSSQQVYSFLKKHKGTAYTLKSLKKRLKTANLWKKLGQLDNYNMINSVKGVVDYPHYKNAHVTYYYVGNLRRYIPRPKQVMV